jgi:hypothetical protein
MGRRIAVSSSIRRAAAERNSALLRVIDLDTGRILATSPVPESPHRGHDPNPRGGLRGARGLGFVGDSFVVANTGRLFVFDRAWQLQTELTHPWMGGIHELFAEREGIWVTCTASDMLLKMGWDGHLLDWWSWRADRRLARSLGLKRPPAFREGVDYRDPRQRGHAGGNLVHLNAVTRSRGELIVSFGRVKSRNLYRWLRLTGWLKSAGEVSAIGRPVVAALERRRLRTEGSRPVPATHLRRGSFALVTLRDTRGRLSDGAAAEVLLHRYGVHVPSHNVAELGDLVVYNDTSRGRLVAHNRSTGRTEHAVEIPGDPSFARGLARFNDTFLVGSQRPAAVHGVDLVAGRLASSLTVSDAPTEGVFSVAMVPDSFDDPPGQLDFHKADSASQSSR